MTIVTSEIGRRNANDTKFIVPPQPALPRPDDRARLDGSKLRRLMSGCVETMLVAQEYLQGNQESQ